MSHHAWDETTPSVGKKRIAIHPMADGFLINMIWNWKEENIHQEIVFFTPLDQAREIAEEILTHIGRINMMKMNRGASHHNKLGPPTTGDTA